MIIKTISKNVKIYKDYKKKKSLSHVKDSKVFMRIMFFNYVIYDLNFDS